MFPFPESGAPGAQRRRSSYIATPHDLPFRQAEDSETRSWEYVEAFLQWMKEHQGRIIIACLILSTFIPVLRLKPIDAEAIDRLGELY